MAEVTLQEIIDGWAKSQDLEASWGGSGYYLLRDPSGQMLVEVDVYDQDHNMFYVAKLFDTDDMDFNVLWEKLCTVKIGDPNYFKKLEEALDVSRGNLGR